VRRLMLQQQHHFGEMISYHASPAPFFIAPSMIDEILQSNAQIHQTTNYE
jgi:hypothetical protein